VRLLLLLLLATLIPAALAAQQTADSTHSFCLRARPAPRCRWFPITNAGVYVPYGGRVVLDDGVMFNTGLRDAVGGSLMVSVGGYSIAAPMLTYRRWFARDRSLDVGVGIPVGGDLKAGSIVSAVRYSPVHWLGIGIRPEYRRHTEYACTATQCVPYARAFGHLSVGAELQGLPGVGATVLGAAAMAALFALLIGETT
jgi:hypothetical protein